MFRILAGRALTPEGWQDGVEVAVGDDGRIVSVAPGHGAAADRTVPVLLPAVANLHSHTFQRAMAGLAERRGPAGRDSFWTWRAVMYRFLDLLDPDDVEAVAAMAFVEMLEAGYAAVAEFHYLHHAPGGAAYADPAELAGRIAAAAATARIGLTLAPVLYRRGGFDGAPLAGGQQRFGTTRDGFARLVEASGRHLAALPADAGLAVAPHSLRACAIDDVGFAAELLPQRPVHIHVAEQEAEVEACLAATGARPVAHLIDRLAVDGRWCLIHATHMTPQETAALARSGAVAGLCPVTEANLGDGIFAGAAFAGHGGRFGVGTDSNIRISLTEELRQLEYSQRLRERARVVLASAERSAGRFVHAQALAGGAAALGRDSGALAPGLWADMVALDPDRFAGSGAGDGLLDGWIFTGSDAAVTDVWSAGRHAVRDGRHVARAAVARRYRGVVERLAGRL